jgi:hypothetical protein
VPLASIDPRTRSSGDGWAWIALVILLVSGAALLYHETRGTTFWADEWQWILHRRGGGLSTFLDPHNEHLSLVPVSIYKLLFATVGLRHYPAYRTVVIAAHLGVAVLVFVYARPRVGGYVALLAAALIVFFGPGWQEFLWPFQIAWLIALGAGIGALLLLDRHDTKGDIGACLLLGTSLASASPGLAIACGMVVEVARRRRWRDAWIVAGPLALYGIWWLGYQHTIFVRHDIVLAPRFVARAAAGALAALTGLADENSGTFLDWGPVLIAIAAALLVWRVRALRGLPGRALTLLVIVLAFWILTGLGRSYVPVGGLVLMATGDESRYLYIGAVLILLLAIELARGTRPSPPAGLALGAITAVVLISNFGPLRDGARLLRGQARTTVAELGTLELTRSIVAPGYVSQNFLFNVVTAAQYFAVQRSLGSPAIGAAQIAAEHDGVRTSADLQLIAIHRVTLSPAAGASSSAAASPPAVDAIEAGTVTTQGACVTYKPSAFTSVLATSQLLVTLPTGGLLLRAGPQPLSVGVRRFSSQFQQLGTIAPARQTTLRISPDLAPQPWHVRIATQGTATVCGLG